jgi:hypothetical protein
LLPYAAQAAFNSSVNQYKPLCLNETRVNVLETTQNWGAGLNDECIFWLNGMAGTGKSTIARTVAHIYNEQKQLGASFFFSRDVGDLSDAGMFFTSIAVQLAQRSPILKHHICQAIAEQSDIADQSLRNQWRQIVFQPLSMLEADALRIPLVLVIDALDECDDDNHIKAILQLLTDAKDLENVRLRVFVTSRPETPIRLGFRNMPGILHQDLVLHDISRTIVDRDILIFFKHRLSEIRKAFDDLSDEWPGEQTTNLLVSRAHGLFIYASTVCSFIEEGGENWPPRELLCLVLGDNSPSKSQQPLPGGMATTHRPPTEELDQIYNQILNHSFKTVKDERDKYQLFRIFRQVVGAIVTLFEPLSTTALAKLLEVDKEIVNRRIRHLRSILDAQENQESPIRLLHPSFRDFLLNKQRCPDSHFWVNQREAHGEHARNCLQLMSRSLQRNICGLPTPGTLTTEVESSKVDQRLPAHVQYACQYWTDHLRLSSTNLIYEGHVLTFFQRHFLHWLEALSLMRKISDAASMISDLQSIPLVSDPITLQ